MMDTGSYHDGHGGKLGPGGVAGVLTDHVEQGHGQGEVFWSGEKRPRDGELRPSAHEAEKAGDSQHRDGERESNPEEGLVLRAAINQSSFLQLAGDRVQVSFQIPYRERQQG